MIISLINMILPAKRRKQVVEALVRFKKLAEISGGCIRCRITQDVDERNTILYWEEWRTREDLERHIYSPNYRQLLEIIELSAQQPEIKFLTVEKMEGLEVVETVRIAR